MQELSRAVPAYATVSYTALAKTEKQFPDVGGADLYYGGTAYDNHGGLGVQLPTSSETSKTTPEVNPVTAPKPVALNADELLIVPVRALYNREPEFNASKLMHSHIEAPYAVFNAADASRLNVVYGDQVELTLAGKTVEVTARVDAASPTGVVLLPRHLTEGPTPVVPVAGTVKVLQKAETVAHD